MTLRTLCVGALALAMPLMLATAPAQDSGVSAPTPDADALAVQLRLLADNPQDLTALLTAGELATRLGDYPAAGAFFTRAGQIDPGSARLKAGMAALMVHNERPGEALQLFQQAEAMGYEVTAYLADRALAYDLTGDQPRAQRDYRQALKRQADDETTRRYALSLAISGKRDAALDQLDPLVRRSDRGAWRVRSFVLAMTGDPIAAQKIANDMLPPGMATGLQHFFAVLPTLGPVDKAFAVHYGELRPTPERLADARLAPLLTPLPPEPVIKTAVAVADTGQAKPEKARRKRRNDREPPAAITEVAIVKSALPPPPREEMLSDQPAVQPAQPALLAASPAPPNGMETPTQPTAKVRVTPPLSPPISLAAQGAVGRSGDAVIFAQPHEMSSLPPTVPVTPAPPIVASKNDAARVVSPAGAIPNRPVRSDDAVLASIVADLPVDTDTGAVSSPTRAAGKSRPPKQIASVADSAEIDVTTKPAKAKPDDADDGCLPLPKAKAGKGAKASHSTRTAHGAKQAKPSAPCVTAKAADAKSTRKGKEDPAKKEPARIWVQVAGGANERALAKAWAAAKAKAPAAFRGKTGWTTPLRATNRVLTGPFKTNAEAQSFVNLIAKSDISAFVFESEPGQKIDKLGAK